MFSPKTVIPNALVPMASSDRPRPVTFHEQYLVIRPTPYLIQSSLQPTSSGGVLRSGQAVWLEQVIQRTRLVERVKAFVEDVGFVSLDPRLIKRGDGSVPLS
jgi:hypothetical protein